MLHTGYTVLKVKEEAEKKYFYLCITLTRSFSPSQYTFSTFQLEVFLFCWERNKHMHLQLQTYTIQDNILSKRNPTKSRRKNNNKHLICSSWSSFLFSFFYTLHIIFLSALSSFAFGNSHTIDRSEVISFYYIYYFFCCCCLCSCLIFRSLFFGDEDCEMKETPQEHILDSKTGMKENRQLEIRNINHLISFFLYNHYWSTQTKRKWRSLDGLKKGNRKLI